MIRISTIKPYIHIMPNHLKDFIDSGSVDEIFKPVFTNDSIFSVNNGYAVSFSLSGVDPTGLDRLTLDHISNKIAIANKQLPVECILYEYLIITKASKLVADECISEAATGIERNRTEQLNATSNFKNIELLLTIYIPSSQKAAKTLDNAAKTYQAQLSGFGMYRLIENEICKKYSYLLNLEQYLAVSSGKLGRVHIGSDGEYLRAGKRYCQMLSLIERPSGTRPDLWNSRLLGVDCEMVFCSVWQRKETAHTRRKASSVENAIGLATQDLYTAAVGGYNPSQPPPQTATKKAQEAKVDKTGDVLIDIDDGHYYGNYSLFGMIHARDKSEVESVLPQIHSIFSDPVEAKLMEESRGNLTAYVSIFPGQHYNVRKVWLRGDHKANLSFVYSPLIRQPNSNNIFVYETRHNTPFYFCPFNSDGCGNTIVLGSPGTGKSLNANALFTGAMKYPNLKTFIFDQGGSYETNVKALGGSVTLLGLDYPRLNFFRVTATKENIHAISQVIRLMLNKSGVAVGNEDQARIERAVEEMFSEPIEERRLGRLQLPSSLRSGLKRWTAGGIYGAIFDNIEDDLELHDLQLFDFASLGDKHVELLEVEMNWILMLCQNIIRDPANMGTPKHIVIDELWKRVGILPVMSFVLETIKADRKNLAWATLITQSLEDLGEHAARIKNACPNTIFTGGAFDRKLYETFFRLNQRELYELENMQDRELTIKSDGEPSVQGGSGYFKVVKLNLDSQAYARATTKPNERAIREKQGLDGLMEFKRNEKI